MAGKAGPRTAFWVIAVLLVLAFPGSYPSQNGSPNLKPYVPDHWSDAIVVSNRPGGNVDTLGLTPTDRLYVDFAAINSGGSAVTAPFRIDLHLDGQLRHTFEAPAPLDPQAYRFRQDYPIGRLGAGAHTLRMVVDAGEAVAESDESDNQYTRTFIVGGACFPLTTRVSPRGAGALALSREPNCGRTAASLGSPAVPAEVSRQELGLAGEPVARAQRARALAALRAEAQSEGRVRVIVGLRTQGRPLASAAGSSREARARTPQIIRAQQSLANRLSGQDVSILRRFKFMPYVALEVDGAGLEALAADTQVASLQEDLAVKPLLAESVPLVGAPGAWAQGFDGAGQAVAILDTGVDRNHPFLRDRVVSEACYSSTEDPFAPPLCPGDVSEATGLGSARPCASSACVHGTAVAGVAAGRGADFSGVAPRSRIIAIQVSSQCNFPADCIQSFTSDWIAGLERVLELSDAFDIAALNMSFGGRVFDTENCDSKFPAAKAALDNVRAAGIAPIVASGNDESSTGISYPACISSAVSVGATADGSNEAALDEVSEFSNSSPSLDLLAPGQGITSSAPDNRFDTYAGTSLAAPHVAGAWALLKSKAPQASVADLLSVLKATGVPVADSRNDLVKPRIQVDAALDRIVEERPYSSGTRLTLTAQPRPGFQFKGWRGCESPSGNRCVLAMDSVRNVTALFEPSAADLPDLVITTLTGPPTAAAGKDVSISASIHNQGPADAGPFRLGLYLSTDDAVTTGDTWFAACAYEAGLAAGQSATCSRSFPLPPRVRPGRYFPGAVVDDLDQVAENSEANNARLADSGPMEVSAPLVLSRSFVPVILSAAGRNDSFFTSELTLTNRGAQEARLDYAYTAHLGGGSGAASDTLAPGQQKIVPDALDYLRGLGLPLAGSGNRLGTLGVEARGSSQVGVTVRTTTAVPEGRAGLAYPGVPEEEGFEEAVYLCGLRQNGQDRSNLALQHMGTSGEGPVTLRAAVFSGDGGAAPVRVLEEVRLGPGGFHQYTGVLGRVANGYVKVERVEGTAPFYAYGVINDQANSDGSFVFPVTAGSLAGTRGQTLPVIVDAGGFASELTVTNFSEAAKTVQFSLVADAVGTADHTARFSLRLEAGEQRIVPDLVGEMRRQGVEGLGPEGRALAGALFATVEGGDMSGIVTAARTGSSGGGGQYSVFYNGVPDGRAFSRSAWVEALQQDRENRSNLALVNTGAVDDSHSLFRLEIYDGETGRRVKTLTRRVAARRWHQINGILGSHAPGTSQGYVWVRRVSGNNPFLAYGVVNDGGAPGERSGDGAYVPARE